MVAKVSSPQSTLTADRTLEMLRTAMGSVITNALDDPAVIEIMVNPDGRLWLDKLGQGRFDTNSRLEPDEAGRVVRLVASHIHQDHAFLFAKARSQFSLWMITWTRKR